MIVYKYFGINTFYARHEGAIIHSSGTIRPSKNRNCHTCGSRSSIDTLSICLPIHLSYLPAKWINRMGKTI